MANTDPLLCAEYNTLRTVFIFFMVSRTVPYSLLSCVPAAGVNVNAKAVRCRCGYLTWTSIVSLCRLSSLGSPSGRWAYAGEKQPACDICRLLWHLGSSASSAVCMLLLLHTDLTSRC